MRRGVSEKHMNISPMMLYDEKGSCTGCTACESICAKGAVAMRPDTEGFLYPVVDTQSCSGCGLCISVCPIHAEPKRANTPMDCFAAKHTDEKIRLTSTSGGVFTALSDEILSRNGIVYGAAYTQAFDVVHSRASSKEQRDAFKGSKYVQSDLRGIFKQVKKDLQDVKSVLFSGTGCQIAGLNAYLGKLAEMPTFFTCEILCHAAPSPLMWKEHVRLLETKKKGRLVCYNSRSKAAGWHAHNEQSLFENGKSDYRSKLTQNHKDLFYSHYIIRPACFACKYVGKNRVGDLTIGDFWGIELCLPDFDDNKGISMMMVNSAKGKELLDAVSGSLHLRASTYEDALRVNHGRPARKNPRREMFWQDYYSHGYLYVVKRYAGYSLHGRLLYYIKRIARCFINKIFLYRITYRSKSTTKQGAYNFRII